MQFLLFWNWGCTFQCILLTLTVHWCSINPPLRVSWHVDCLYSTECLKGTIEILCNWHSQSHKTGVFCGCSRQTTDLRFPQDCESEDWVMSPQRDQTRMFWSIKFYEWDFSNVDQWVSRVWFEWYNPYTSILQWKTSIDYFIPFTFFSLEISSVFLTMRHSCCSIWLHTGQTSKCPEQYSYHIWAATLFIPTQHSFVSV